ncbi:hypothetical protein EV363DRAFT_1300106 [Boletus edulis]|nr:hypothetical protein EV363DRAFT_1300106 [Boletus edulis]
MDQENPMLDFVDEEARPLREALGLAFGWDEDQAIQHLEATWRNNQEVPEPRDPPPGNDQAPPQGGPPQVRLDELVQQPEQPEQPQEKKKPTIADFEEDEPPPNAIAARPLQYALQKIAAFEYVELWYFMWEGCFEATKQSRSQADDAFGLLATNEVLTLRPECQGGPRALPHGDAPSPYLFPRTPERSRLAEQTHLGFIHLLLDAGITPFPSLDAAGRPHPGHVRGQGQTTLA